MRAIFLILIALLAGCGNLNPRFDPKIDNQNGEIEELRNNQNGLMLELGKIRNDAEIQNSQLKEVQQGMLNMNAAISRNENSGVQILQGDGALILIFSTIVVGMLLYHYRDRAVKSEKASEILAQEIVNYNDPVLNDEVLKAAMHTPVEIQVYKLLNR